MHCNTSKKFSQKFYSTFQNRETDTYDSTHTYTHSNVTNDEYYTTIFNLYNVLDPTCNDAVYENFIKIIMED